VTHSPDRAVTVRELVSAAGQSPALREALAPWADRAGQLQPVAIGKVLTSRKGRIVHSLRLERVARDRRGSWTWRVGAVATA
jgi:hypothetical protein